MVLEKLENAHGNWSFAHLMKMQLVIEDCDLWYCIPVWLGFHKFKLKFFQSDSKSIITFLSSCKAKRLSTKPNYLGL